MEESIEQLIQDFEFNVIKYWEYIELCKSKKANAHFDKYRKIVVKINTMDNESRDKFLALIYSDNPLVAYSAAHYNLKYATNECLHVLKKIEGGSGIVSLNAEYSLKSWYDGTWKEL